MNSQELASQIETMYQMITQFQNDEEYAKEYITRYIIFLGEESKYIPQTILDGYKTNDILFEDIWLLTSVYYQYSVKEKDPLFLTKELLNDGDFKEKASKFSTTNKSDLVSLPQFQKVSPIPSFSMVSKESILGKLGKIHSSVTYLLRKKSNKAQAEKITLKLNIENGVITFPEGKTVSFNRNTPTFKILKALLADNGLSPIDIKIVLYPHLAKVDSYEGRTISDQANEIAKYLRKRLFPVKINNKSGKLSLINAKLVRA